MKLEFHDGNVNDTVKANMSGPTHAGTVHVDYEYQVEEYVRMMEDERPEIIRILLVDNGREWLRRDGRFVESTQAGGPADE